MVLETRTLTFDFSRRPPAEMERMLADVAERADRFRQRRGGSTPVGFHCSAFDLLHQCFEQLQQQNLTRGRFCEWGAGLGVASCLSTRFGFEQAWGIEIDAELVAESRRLAADYGSSARFVVGSFLPAGGSALVDELDDLSRFDLQAPPVYDTIGPLEEFDVIYAYPWPGERRFFDELFDRYARPGALMLSFHGSDEFRLQQKR